MSIQPPKELDVPHWARHIVKNHRENLKLPPRVTDRMIYARVVESGSHREDEVTAVMSLIDETIGILTPELKEKIDSMSHMELCRAWRFAPVGDELFQGDVGDYLLARLETFGGFTPAISKAIGWGR